LSWQQLKTPAMRSIFFFLFALSIISCQSSKTDSNIRQKEYFSKNFIDSTIRQLENVEWAKASTQKDTQWFHSHIADELVVTTGRTGEISNKKQTIDEIKDPSYGSGGSDKLEDLKITSFENTAVATFKILTNGKDKTGSYFRVARYTEVWIYRDDRWQLLASHSSLMPDSK